MLGIDSGSKAFGTQVVLDEQTWALPDRGVVGLVGVNGAGKTTLLRILAEEEPLDSGRLVRPKTASVGYLPQEIGHSERSGSLLETILVGRSDLLDMEVELDRIGHQMQSTAESAVYAELQHEFETGGGYTFRSTAREIAVGLGFSSSDFDRPIDEFSGGWQMRALLARLLLSEPTLLLMDEPTNHLDVESVEWLERYLGRYPGCVVIVSHDRYFLNRMVTHVVDLSRGILKTYTGSYDRFLALRDEEHQRLRAASARQKREIERVERFVERFRYKATKAKQAQSRLKSLEKMDIIETDSIERNAMDFRFPQPPRLGRIVAEFRDVSFGYEPGNLLYQHLNFSIERKQRVALVGPNGAGKSTMLKLLAQRLVPQAGGMELGNNVEISYFAQHALDELDATNTVLAEVQSAATQETGGSVRDVLGAFGFSGDTVKKTIGVLSGGEKNRVALAKLMMNPGGLLLLDEPTNHLDIPSRQVLEAALEDFEGAIVTVSHDRFFINQIATHTVHVENGELTTYFGDYDEYVWKRSQEGGDQPTETEETDDKQSRKDMRRAAAELRQRQKSATKELDAEIAQIEASIATLEAEHETLTQALMDSAVFSDPELAAEKSRGLKAAERELERLMEVWEATSAALEEIKASFVED